MRPVKLVTFDVTGTLLFFKTPIIDKYISTGLKYGLQVDSAVLRANFKNAWKTLNEEHSNFGRDTGLGWKNWWTKFVEKTYADFKKPQNVQITQIAEDLLNFHTTADAFTIRPGTTELLCHLKSKNVQLGVISNYDERLETILTAVGIRKYFDFVLVSYQFGFTKPDRKIFQEAMRLGHCSSACEGIHIGDDNELDYHGAKKAGMRAILLRNDNDHFHKTRVESNDVLPDFFTVKRYLETIT